eukprot:Seg382.14 transcript_id=Seg382.14/GoldUCD/mRNA.D3Y31 product="hypothetical protein" protein_id=Seg382.14/GoldUCD/D3Y31
MALFKTILISVAVVAGAIESSSFSRIKRAKSCPNEWDQLSVTFPNLHQMPMTEAKAKANHSLWKKMDNKPCDGHASFVGNRYIRDNEHGALMLYDKNGKLAGMQAALPPTIIIPANYAVMLPQENNKYLLTAYFTHPDNICNPTPRQEGCVGDSLYIQIGATASSIFKVPLKEPALSGTRWTQGKCFPGMGVHYWYDVSKGMSCDNFFPVFLLYNGGKLNAFGWVVGGDANDGNFEHPPAQFIPYFFKPETQPRCVSAFAVRSTQHIFFQSSRMKYTC